MVLQHPIDPKLPKEAEQQGFILLGGTTLLLLLAWLLLFSWEQSRQQGLLSQQQQRRYWQSLTQSLSALAIAPYLSWPAASQQWQCQTAAQRQICMKQRYGNAALVLLRAGPLTPSPTDPVILYRWAKVISKQSCPSPSSKTPDTTLIWVTGGWLDSCPEAEPYLCQ